MAQTAIQYITHRRMDQTVHTGKHIGSVKLRTGAVLTRDQVLNLMRQGTTFYTYNMINGHEARVIPRHCHDCGTEYITTTPDAWRDDNLDALPYF